MMYRILWMILFLTGAHLKGQHPTESIPEWFRENIHQSVGTWEADNSEHISDLEPYVAYGIKWEAGLEGNSMTGTLYGTTKSDEKDDLWNFMQYFDNQSKEARIIQLGRYNVVGKGKLQQGKDNSTESYQVFTLLDGRAWEEKHITTITDGWMITTSYQKNQLGEWEEKRTYQWKKKNE